MSKKLLTSLTLFLAIAVFAAGCSAKPDPEPQSEFHQQKSQWYSQEYANEDQEPSVEIAELDEPEPKKTEQEPPNISEPDSPQEAEAVQPAPEPEQPAQDPTPAPEPIPVQGIGLNRQNLSLAVGQTSQLRAQISPANADNQGVNWTSSNPGAVSVSNSGLVTARGNGTATITAVSIDGGKSTSANVTVSTPVSGISLSPASLNLNVNQTAQLSATIQPSTASNRNVTWSSSNTQVATVNSSGRVTARSGGTATITATAADGGKTATASVTVAQPQQGAATADEMQMLNLVNQERQQAGVPPLKLNIELTKVARIKSQDMIDLNYFSHTSPVYGSPFDMMEHYGILFTAAGENLARHPSVASAHQGLMNSEGHRKNILSTVFTEIGIGIVRDSRGQYFVTQMFIRN